MTTARSEALSTDGQPSVAYLLGAMLADGVDPGLAARVADGYGVALGTLAPEELLQWRLAVLAKLNAGAETVFATFAHPSEHEAPRYLALAASHRPKGERTWRPFRTAPLTSHHLANASARSAAP